MGGGRFARPLLRNAAHLPRDETATKMEATDVWGHQRAVEERMPGSARILEILQTFTLASLVTGESDGQFLYEIQYIWSQPVKRFGGSTIFTSIRQKITWHLSGWHLYSTFFH